MKVLLKSLKSKRAFISVGLLASFSAIFVYSQILAKQSLSIENLSGGIQTCFTRVNQTYTAKMIGDKNRFYLSPEFMMTSEECLAEALTLSEELVVSGFVLKQINKLVADTHWFHEKLESKKSPFSTTVSLNDISTRFEKIEGLKDVIIEGNDSMRTKVKNSISSLSLAMLVIGFLSVFLFVWEVRDQRRRIALNNLVEREAEVELLVDGVPQSSRVERVFTKVFENNDLEQCSLLFQKYHSAILDGHMQYMITKDYHEDLQREDQNDKLVASQQESDLNADKEYKITLLEGGQSEDGATDSESNMENVLTQVVEHLSSSVFHKGIRFELVVDDNMLFNADNDILEQIFFHALNYSISSCEEVSTKHINVGLHRLGGTAIFEISDSGIGFDPLLIKQEIGISRESDFALPLELKIVKELIRENHGELLLENIISDEGMVTGSKIRVIFRLQQNRDLNRGLVQIRKATKRELTREFSQTV